MADKEHVIQTVALRKVFKDFWHRDKVVAVDSLDLQIDQGEIFGLLGPNGSGKSTTIKMILGLLHPTSGVVSVFDQPPSDVKTKQRIGFLPEESYLYPFLSAAETLDYYGRLFRQPRHVRRQRTEMLLDMVGLSNVAYRRVGEYSKGMQRRIGLAQALINDPDLLILDEPTSGLDPIGARQFKDLITELGQRGKTVILSSHLLDDVEDVCDRVSILYGGRQRAIGDVSELLSQDERTQIISQRLSDKTINAIKKIIAEDEGSELIEVSAPKDRLESLFLKIVDQAQKDKLSTGGALATGEMAEFLRADSDTKTGTELINELVSTDNDNEASGQQPASIEAAAPQPDKNIDKNLLEQMTTSSDDTPEINSNDETSETEQKPQERINKSILDSLTGEDNGDKQNG